MAHVKVISGDESLATIFGERIGECIEPRNLRIVGHWLFHRIPECEEDEVACYRLPLPMCAEAWDGIPMSDSPFAPIDPNTLERVIKQLDRGYEALN